MTDGLPFAIVQTVNPAMSSGASITVTPANTKLRSLLLVFVGMSGHTDTGTSVTDNAGNTYTRLYRVNAAGGCLELYYARNCQPTTSVVVAFSGSTDTKSVFLREWSGMSQAANVADTFGTTSGATSGGGAFSMGASWSPVTSDFIGNNIQAVCSSGQPVTAGFVFGGGLATQNNGTFSHSIDCNSNVFGVAGPGSSGTGLFTVDSGFIYNMGISTFKIRGYPGYFGGTPNLSTTRPHAYQPGNAR